MSGPDYSNLEYSAWFRRLGVSPSGLDILGLKKVDIFTRTSVSVSKMNAVAHAQLTLQMLTLLQKYLTRLLHGPDCFTVSTLCTYTDLGSWGCFVMLLFFTMFPSLYHHEIFSCYYHWQKWFVCKWSWSEVKDQDHRGKKFSSSRTVWIHGPNSDWDKFYST